MRVNNRCFTMIELMVVIAIIGVLAGLVLNNMGSGVNAAKKTATKLEMGAIVIAAEHYARKEDMDDADKDGISIATLKSKGFLKSKVNEEGNTDDWTKDAWAGVPKPNGSGDITGNYDFSYNSSFERFEVISNGPDGEKSGTGKDQSILANKDNVYSWK